jgi:hypothetical protein
MESIKDEYQDRFVVRRLTSSLINSLCPRDSLGEPFKSSGEGTAWDSIKDAAKKIGVGIIDMFKVAMVEKKPDATKYPKSVKGGRVPNLYGYFLVIIDQGKIDVVTDAGKYSPPKGAELFLVADLVGLPLARITGSIGRSEFDTSAGEISDAQYAINMWLDPGVTSWSKIPTVNSTNKDDKLKQDQERVGRFLQHFMEGRDDLTIEDFLLLAKKSLQPIINATLTLDNLKNLQLIDSTKLKFNDSACRLLGVTTEIIIRPGNQIFRHQLTIDETTIGLYQGNNATTEDSILGDGADRVWVCQCKVENPIRFAFCDGCGAPKPSAIDENSRIGRKLVSADGDQVIFDLSFVSYDKLKLNTDEIAIKCIEILRPICRKYPIDNIGDPNVLSYITTSLNKAFGTGTLGSISEFSIIDFRSSDTDWRLQTRAKIKDQLRNVGDQKAELEVDEAKLALREAQLITSRRELNLEENENNIDIQKEKINLESDLNRTSMRSTFEVDERKVHAKNEIDIEKIDREVDRERKKLDRDDLEESVLIQRKDQFSQLDHEMNLEDTVMRHDIIKEQTLNDVKRKKEKEDLTFKRENDEQDLSFEEKAARLRATRSIDIERAEQNLDLEKKREIQALELEKLRLEEEMHLKKLQMMAEQDRQQKEVFKGLSASQILAMQASDLAQKGAGSTLEKLAGSETDIAKAQYEMESKLSAEKAAMYEKMIELQNIANQNLLNSKDSTQNVQLEMFKAALQSSKDTAQGIQNLNDKALQSAENWNQKSIDAMSKVATAAASTRGDQNIKVDVSPQNDATVCPSCKKLLPDGTKKCPDCGSK